MTALHRHDKSARAVSAHRADDEVVLNFAEIKPGIDRTQLSRFGDDVWDLTPAIFRENVALGAGILRFGALSDAWQKLTAKEYMWARLNGGSPNRRTVMAPTTARGVFDNVKRILHFIKRHAGVFSMDAVDQILLDAYLAYARSSGTRTPQQISRILEVAIDLHRHQDVLTLGGYACRPWRGRSAPRIAGCPPKSGENRTPRIPEPVIDILLRWALKYVDHFAGDILAAGAERDRLERKRRTTKAAVRTVAGQFDSYIRARRRAGRGIPVWSLRAEGEEPDFNFPLIAAQVGCSTGMLYHPEAFRAHLSFAADWIGVEVGGMDTPISNDPDTGEPWRARFDNASLDHEQRMLQAACYIICAYLSGMRDSEIQAMRLNCLDITRSADGVIECYRVRSFAYKGRGAKGYPEEWITIAPVARAIDVLKRLSAAARRKRGALSLWPMLSERGAPSPHLGVGVNALLNDFRAHLDAAYGDETAPIVPAIDGKAWRLTTRQFRRTVAWFIANRPFGAVAGKIQYKHASIAMFEGYAGGGEAGFRREVEQERALGQLDDIVDHYEDFKRGLKPAGPASARILAEFEQVKDKLGDLPGRIIDRQRLRAMLAQLARTLHVGLLNDCFFDPATAFCLDRTKTAERGAPMLSHCSPDRCPNACITRRHLAPWRDSIADGEALLKDKRLSAPQKRALREEIARKKKLIAPLAEAPSS